MSTNTDSCNVCGETEKRHHLVVETVDVFGATIWVYDDGFARVVPQTTPYTLNLENYENMIPRTADTGVSDHE